MNRLHALLGALCALALFITPQAAMAVPFETVPSADLTGDNDVNSADFQCLVRLNAAIQSVGGPTQDHCDTDADCGDNHFCDLAFAKKLCLPDCLADRSVVGDNSLDPNCFEQGDNDVCFVGIPRHNADLNCDRVINNADFQILVAIVLQKLGGPGTPDIDNDGILNFCDPDSDGDGDPDETDCAPNDPEIHAEADEICDGIDNNCNLLVDAEDPELVVELCEKQDGVCEGISTTQCVDGKWLECLPVEYDLWSEDYEKTETLCDGLDNDCDGLTDDEDGDLVDGCGCGDGVCEGDEDCDSCPADCKGCVIGCDDGICAGDESCLSCPQDCGQPLDDGTCDSVECGDNTCGPSENCHSCWEDCGHCPPPCGDGVCSPGESCSSCEKDCGICPEPCGNGACLGDEDCATCPEDCGDPVSVSDEGCCAPSDAIGGCEDKACSDCVCAFEPSCCAGVNAMWSPECVDLARGAACTETCGCEDCEGTGPECGDDVCQADEDILSCPEDCGEIIHPCGDGICDVDAGDNCIVCPGDCGPCPIGCVDGICQADEDCLECPEDCGAPDDSGQCVGQDECGDTICTNAAVGGTEDCESCWQDCGICTPPCGDGQCTGSETCSSCPGDCGTCGVGDCDTPPCGDCGDDICQAGESCLTCADDCGNPAADGTCIGPDGEGCGDDICTNAAVGGTEDCESCSKDCGLCESVCKDGLCTGDEDCESCPEDCGGKESCPGGCQGDDCPVPCGDGTCETGENCGTCSADCGECTLGCGPDLTCGDGVCSSGEACGCCSADCGICPIDYCGDGECAIDEDCLTCPTDCGEAPLLPDAETNSCCSGDPATGGCGDFGCSECVCDFMPECCGAGIFEGSLVFAWSDACADLATGICGGICPCTEDSCGDPICGDGICQAGEQADCIEDCIDDDIVVCGDGFCASPVENCSSCPQDCQDCIDFCENGFCGPAEDCFTCPQDCGDMLDDFTCGPGEGCGDKLCSADEDCTGCPEDCGECLPLCKDGFCAPSESCSDCPEDCGPCECDENAECCGDGVCMVFETCAACPQDCGDCVDPPGPCGDGICEFHEDCETCAPDCGTCPCDSPPCASICGDKICGPGEGCGDCPEDCGGPCVGDGCNSDGLCASNESCLSCPDDCGQPLDDGTCDEGVKTCGVDGCQPEAGENCENCEADCGECPPVCQDGVCELDNGESCETCPQDCGEGTLGDGSCCASNTDGSCNDGSCLACVCQHRPWCCANPTFNNWGPSSWDESCSAFAESATCTQECECKTCGDDNPVCGDGTCNGDEDCTSCAQDCGDCIGPDCGDGLCQPGETCTDCSEDCGICGPECGDKVCVGIENCFNCSEDCGEPVDGSCEPPDGPVCGDGLCSPTENCLCEEDCGQCPIDFCGDTVCNGGEGCGDCPEDCGPCTGLCGDEICESMEDCHECAADCGSPQAPGDCDGPAPDCGDGTCNGTEDCTSCIKDCGNCTGKPECNNGVCEDDEDCQSCQIDCGECPCAVPGECPACSDGTCDPSESCATCPIDCGQCPVGCFPSTKSAPCAPDIEDDDGESVVIAPDCSGACVGGSVEAATCAIDACYSDYVLSANYSSPTSAPLGSGMRAITQYGDGDNDLAPTAGPSYLSLGSGDIQTSSTHDYFTMVSLPDPFSNDGLYTYDVVEFTLEMVAPPGVTGFSFDYIFMSAEYEEFIGSKYNDRFYAILDAPITTGGQERVINYAPCSNPAVYSDFSDADGSWCYIAINTAFSEPCSNPTTDISGTPFACPPEGGGSSTGWLTTTYPITAGETFTLTFHIHDTSDSAYDSVALIDNFRWRDGDIVPDTTTQIPCDEDEDDGGTPICGDGTCSNGEHCGCCPQDCGPCPDICEDGVCGLSEDCFNCPIDCGQPTDATVPSGLDSDCCSTDEADGPGCSDDLCNDCLCAIEPSCCTAQNPAFPDSGWTSKCGTMATVGECAGACSCGLLTCGEDPVCTDGICNGDETCTTCPGDCGTCINPPCGDNVCEAGKEDCSSCPNDCGQCPDGDCGNGTCQAWESCTTCPEDCGDPLPDGTCGGDDPECGDPVCTAPIETCTNCEEDCGPCIDVCGDGTCGDTEGCSECPGDCDPCTPTCGNGLCDADETCDDCKTDCGNPVDGSCEGPCGNGACGPTESPETCPEDCGGPPECGDGSCDPGETCEDCLADCGECPDCGNGACALFEDCINCPLDCGLPFDDGTCGVECGDGVCSILENPENCQEDCGGVGVECGNGVCDEPTETCTKCALDCGVCPGDCGDGVCQDYEDCESCKPDCVSLEAGDVEPPCETGECGDGICQDDENCAECAADCGGPCGGTCGVDGCQPEAGENCVSCPVDCGSCTPDCDTPPCPECGDGECTGGETCKSCAQDCGGSCPLTCKDGICTPGEDCFECPEDCGYPPPGADTCTSVECGDGLCDQGGIEFCGNCPEDCGVCPIVCGNDYCEQGEGCDNCPKDCGFPCEGPCGDALCSAEEDCFSCPVDCGNGFYVDGVKQCEPVDGGPFCGDDTCSSGETCASCEDDCGQCPDPECGDGVCNGDETCLTCADCAPCEPNCDDGVCDAVNGEDCETCKADCGECPPPCGDDVCTYPETCHTCPQDCGESLSAFTPYCCAEAGDCNEVCLGCVMDQLPECITEGWSPTCGVIAQSGTCNEACECLPCGPSVPDCGDGVCDTLAGENCEGCEDDCGNCDGTGTVCGDGVCSPGEDCVSCAEDCACEDDACYSWQCTDAGVCEQGAPSQNCDDQNPCTTDGCDPDTGLCTHSPIADCTSSVVCTLTGEAGDWVSCPVNYARATTLKPPAVACDILFTFDAAMVADKELSACTPLPDIPPAQCIPGDGGDAYCAGAFDASHVCDVTLGRCTGCSIVSTQDSLTLATSHTASTCDTGAGDCDPGEMLLFIYSFAGVPLTDSYLDVDAKTLINDPYMLDMRFQLAESGTLVISYDHDASTFSDELGQEMVYTFEYNQGIATNPDNWFQTDDIKAGDPIAACEEECDDQNPCTDDICDADLVCTNTPNTADCDDEDDTTVQDVCSDGVCGGQAESPYCTCNMTGVMLVANTACQVDVSACDPTDVINAEAVDGLLTGSIACYESDPPGLTTVCAAGGGAWALGTAGQTLPDNPCGTVLTVCDGSLGLCIMDEVPVCTAAHDCVSSKASCGDDGWGCDEQPLAAGTACNNNDTVPNGICDSTGTCVASCVGSCDGKACGDDGCGVSCGTCGAGESCTTDGQCVCTPNCAGKICGDNGCGGLCGQCPAGDLCVEDGTFCECQPQCDGKVCGDNGCGGSCGQCDNGFNCEEDGEICVCQPQCDGKTCGDDGCGGQCGTCTGSDTCVDGQCTAPCNTCPPAESWYQGVIVTDAVVGDSLCTLDTTYIVCEAGPPGQCPTWSSEQDCMTIEDDYTCTQVVGYNAECGWDQ